MNKNKWYNISTEQIEDIAKTVDNCCIYCERCRINHFCNEGKYGSCEECFVDYISGFVSDSNISYDSLSKIADDIAFSLNECFNCQIQEFCDKNSNISLCSSTWMAWLLKKIGSK